MDATIANLVKQIRALEIELEGERAKQHANLGSGFERGKAFFEQELLRRHREMRTTLKRYVFNARPLVVLTAPVIYLIILPLVILDLFVTLYQAICFPVYGIQRVKRSDFFAFDRANLGYLNAIEKLNCAYCSYANGLINYTREVAARTEKHWCPIKHARRVLGTHEIYASYSEYGDAEQFLASQKNLTK